jgi:hypothetical protein
MLTLDAPPRTVRAAPVRHSPWSSRRWCDYFTRQRGALLSLPWERGAELTPAERDLVAASLREFQQGEGHEGGHFFRCARAYAERCDADYAEAHRLFMAEERRHADDLARFLALAGVPLLTERSLLNHLFCWGASRGGLELAVAIILPIEIVGSAYYAALRRASGSAVLRCLCAQILRDEKQHVRFQCERLAVMRRDRRRALRVLSHALDLLLFVGAGCGCWFGHRRVLRAGGVGLARFWREAWARFRGACRQKDPRHYAPADTYTKAC